MKKDNWYLRGTEGPILFDWHFYVLVASLAALLYWMWVQP